MAGLLTSQEMAGIVDAFEQELRRNTMAAEVDQHGNEATIITAARDLQLQSPTCRPQHDRLDCGLCAPKAFHRDICLSQPILLWLL
ncbi:MULTISPECIES: hypothetical protein [unclassified Bradyrhizobium]